ncbi:SRPBCC family protein [Qipengyuania sp. DSG2-2]|uniref:SRPBCC family protein n=1 Tax=Qipengyuania sp. DGS2-2 TaxID=3349631 RepID=UPI0036D3854D
MYSKTFATAACAAGLILSAPAAAEVIDQSDDGFVTQDGATVNASPQAVWLALISPGEWWNDAHTWSGDAGNMTLEPQANGCFCERIPATEEDGAIGLAGSVRHMTVIQSFPRRVLRMRGGLGPLQSEPADGVLTITMKGNEDNTETQINWTYVVGGHMRFEVPVIAKAVDGVMSQQLTGLTEKLGGAVGGRDAVPSPEADETTDEPADEPEADDASVDGDEGSDAAGEGGDDSPEETAEAPPKRAIDAADVLDALDALATTRGE